MFQPVLAGHLFTVGVPEGEHYKQVSLYDIIIVLTHDAVITVYIVYSPQQVQDSTTSPSTTTCVRRDPRLLPSNSASCTDYSPPPSFNVEVANITYGHTTLHPIRMAAGLSTVEIEELTTSLLSNILPQSARFNTGGPTCACACLVKVICLKTTKSSWPFSFTDIVYCCCHEDDTRRLYTSHVLFTRCVLE